MKRRVINLKKRKNLILCRQIFYPRWTSLNPEAFIQTAEKILEAMRTKCFLSICVTDLFVTLNFSSVNELPPRS